MNAIVAALAVLLPSPEQPAADVPASDAVASQEGASDVSDRAPDAYPRTRVVVGVATGDASISAQELSQVLDGHFADTGLQPRVASISGAGDRAKRLKWASTYALEPDVLAVFWIEGEGNERGLFLFEPREGTTWTRSVPSSSPDELLESLGAMMRGISLWMEAGPPPGMDAVEEPAPASVKPSSPPPREPPGLPPSPPPARPRWSLALAYAGGSLSDEAPWQSGGQLSVDLELPLHLVGYVGAAIVSPARLRALPRTTVWRVPLTLGVGYRFRADRSFRPQLDAALVVEPTWWRATSTPEVEARSGSAARVAVAPGAGLRWSVRGGFGLMLHLRADLRLLDADLVVSQGGTRVPRLSPHRVAAFARAGFFYVF